MRIINDASMQALGSYHGRRMLFLGLGTGLGSALVWDNYVLSLELGDLPYRNGSIIEDYLGKLARYGSAIKPGSAMFSTLSCNSRSRSLPIMSCSVGETPRS